ncbi:MAG: hypothetical protein LBD85_01190 [Oscillospiraceae bacterium]|nr:hypothetical protein [Oscillospiraceae bacterium]
MRLYEARQKARFGGVFGEENVFLTEAHRTLLTERTDSGATVYALVRTAAYTYTDGVLLDVGGSYIPTALTFEFSGDGVYTLSEYWLPGDGSYFAPSIREKFPESVQTDAISNLAFAEELSIAALRSAQRRFGITDFTPPEVTAARPPELAVGSAPDWAEYFRVTDDADGEISLENAYVWDVMVDLSAAGRYPLQISVQDRSGNQTRAEFEIAVK